MQVYCDGAADDRCGQGADPGFSIGGGANHPGRGHQPIILPNFPKNCMKLRTFWTVGGEPGSPPLDLPLVGIPLPQLLASHLTDVIFREKIIIGFLQQNID